MSKKTKLTSELPHTPETSVKNYTPSIPEINDAPYFVDGFSVLNAVTPPHKFLIEGLVPLHVISLLCGPSDTGKSILARQIAIASALGKSKVAGFDLNLTYNRALYVSTEDGINDWKEKLARYNLSPSEVSKISNLTLCFEFNPDTLRLIEAKLKTEPTDVIIIDVLADTFNSDLNNSVHVRQYFLPFKHLAAKYRCNIFFVHHVSKKGEASMPSKANVMGSQGIESAMRCVLELRSDPSSEDHRHLIITKSNYVSQHDKKLSYRLLLKPTLEFEFQDERAPMNNLGNSSKVNQQVLVDQVLEMKRSNPSASVREIEKLLADKGIKVGKTRIAEIIKNAGQDPDTPELVS